MYIKKNFLFMFGSFCFVIFTGFTGFRAACDSKSASVILGQEINAKLSGQQPGQISEQNLTVPVGRISEQEQGVGKQLIIELYGCDSKIIDDIKLVEAIMLEAAHAAHATVVTQVFHKFAPQGVSGVVVVSESHLAIHTWPEFGYCAVDIFTCGNLCDNDAAFEVVKKRFCAQSSTLVKVKRGVFAH